jgi:hypothetical protein
MNSHLDLTIPIERITWRDGQDLDSRDLRDSQSNAERFRHLHIHYQHKTWGVVEGLNVVALRPSMAGVTQGYALDIEGAEMLVPTLTPVPVPENITTATTMYLVISRNGGASTCSCESSAAPDLTTLCPGITSSVSLWRGTLSWKTLNEVRVGLDVLLARAVVADGMLASKIDTSIQRRAATMAQSRIWSDATQAGQTGWIDGTEAQVPTVSATVDTSDAGFVAIPVYFAWLTGTFGPIEGFISTASATSFTFVLQQAVTTSTLELSAATANSDGWTIQWFAVELLPAGLLSPLVTA